MVVLSVRNVRWYHFIEGGMWNEQFIWTLIPGGGGGIDWFHERIKTSDFWRKCVILLDASESECDDISRTVTLKKSRLRRK